MSFAGNKPPWSLPAKAAYGNFDLPRAMKYFKSPQMTAPPFFPIMSLLVRLCSWKLVVRYPR